MVKELRSTGLKSDKRKLKYLHKGLKKQKAKVAEKAKTVKGRKTKAAIAGGAALTGAVAAKLSGS